MGIDDCPVHLPLENSMEPTTITIQLPHFVADLIATKPYLLFAFFSSFVCLLLEMYLGLRQLAALQSIKETPIVLRGYIKNQWLQRINNFSIARIRFSIFESTLSLCLEFFALYNGWLVQCWEASGFALDYISIGRDHLVTRGVLFILFVSLLSTFFKLCFHLTRSFLIDSHHNLSNFSQELWDQIKIAILSLLMGIPTLLAILRIIQWTGTRYYLYVWMILATLTLFIQSNFIHLLTTIISDVKVLPRGVLRNSIQALGKELGLPVVDILVLRGGSQALHANAFVSGMGNTKRIVLYESMLNQNKNNPSSLSELEICAIVAHEMAHVAHGHFWKKLLFQLITLFLSLYSSTYFLFNPLFYSSFGFDVVHPAIGLVLFGYCYQLIGNLIHWFSNSLSFQYEFESDSVAQQVLTKLRKPRALATALIKMHILNANFNNLNPDEHYSLYYFAHPSLVSRLERIYAISKDNTH